MGRLSEYNFLHDSWNGNQHARHSPCRICALREGIEDPEASHAVFYAYDVFKWRADSYLPGDFTAITHG